MLNTEQSIVNEVEAAIRAGSAEKCLETARRVTDLFLASAGSFNDEQVGLFDDVLERLIKTIEIRSLSDVSARIALAEMSEQLAPIAQAPPSVVRRLARNDDITIAAPVLQESARLGTEDLVEIAQTRGEPHLLAVAGRWWLTEVVTDALLTRHYPGQPARRQQSGRAGLRGRICYRPGAGGIGPRARGRDRHPGRSAFGAPPPTVAQCDGSGPNTAARTRAAAFVRGNPARDRDRRGRRGSRNVQGARLHRGQTLRG